MPVTERLAQFALDLRLENVPAPVVDRARLRILDTLAVTLGGAREECTRIALEVAREVGGRPAATLAVHGDRTSAPMAAFVNGISAHALEYDDMTSSAITHSSASVVPAMLAMGESLGIDGKRFLESYIAGFEVSSRIGWGTVEHMLPRGWHPNGVLCAIGCAASGARLLGADLDRTRAAMAIGASCSSGIRKNVGFMTKPFHMGHAARNGVLAAMLAVRGYTADLNVLESDPSELRLHGGTAGTGHAHYSFPETYLGPGHYDLDTMVRGLGELYELGTDSTITRFHPGSSFPQAAIDEAIELTAKNDIRSEDVDVVEVGVTPTCLAIASYGMPRAGRDALFSAPYSIAVAILDRRAGPRQYTDDRVRRPDIQSLMPRIKLYVPDDFAGVTGGWTGGRLTPVSARILIRLKNGREVRGERHTTKGYPGSPVVWSDVVAKYEECAEPVLGPDRIRRSIQMVAEIEKLPDVARLATELIAD